jgi:hypothetical protein
MQPSRLRDQSASAQAYNPTSHFGPSRGRSRDSEMWGMNTMSEHSTREMQLWRTARLVSSSESGHSRLGRASSKSGHVRYAAESGSISETATAHCGPRGKAAPHARG